MKTLLKILGFSTAILATLIVAAAIFIGWLFDPNDYKDFVAEWVESRTGRDFIIEEDLALTFFPWLGVETGGLQLGNAEGFSEDAFATAERAIVRVKVLPLLLARVELGNLEVDSLVLNLGRDSERRGNWEDLLASTSPVEGINDTAPSGNGILHELSIEGIEISNGLVFWREDTTEVRYVISDFSLETGPILIGQPVRTVLSFALVGVQPQFTAQLTATGNTLINPAGSHYLAENLRLGFNIEDGRHEERAAGSLEATISVSTKDRTITFSESRLETSLTNPPLGPAELQLGATWTSSRLDLDSGDVEIVDLTTNTNGILANWKVAGRNLLEDPELTGEVHIEDESFGAVLDLLNLEVEADAADLGGFDLEAGFALHTTSRELMLTGVNVSAVDMRISGALSADEAGNASGQVTVPPFDPRAALSLLPAAALAGIDHSSIDTFALAAEFRLDGPRQRMSINEIRAEVMTTSITGELDYFHAERRYEGSVRTSAMDPELVANVVANVLPDGLTSQRLGTLRLETGFAYDTVTDELRLDTLDVEALGLLATGDLAVSELSESPRWTGAVHIPRFNPRELFQRFGRAPPVTSDSAALTGAVIDTHLDITTERGLFNDIRLRLDDTLIEGELTVRDFSNPDYDFNFAIDAVDVDRYLPPRTPAQNENETQTPGDRPIEIPRETMHNLALNGQITAGDLRLAGLQFSEASVLLAIGNGIGTIDSARAKLYDGDFEGDMELDARGSEPLLALNGTAVGLQLDPFLLAFRGESNLSGTGNFDLSLNGVGASLNDALESTSGRVNFSLRDGAIRGFNLGHALCSGYNTLRQEPQPAATEDNLTAYQSLRGSAVVTEGIARTGDLQATTSFMQTTGQGQLDLTSRNINYDLIATLTDSIRIAGCQTMDRLIGEPIPVKLTGNINAPKPSPDFGAALENLANEELEEAKNELQDRLRQGVEDLLSR